MIAIKASNHNQLIETSNFLFLMSLAEPYLIKEENKIYSSYVSIHLSICVCVSIVNDFYALPSTMTSFRSHDNRM